MLAHVLKKVLSAFLHPVGLCLLLLVIGLVFLYRTGRRRLGGWLISLAALWLLISSLPMTSYFMLRPLEATAGPCVDPAVLRKLGVQHILVLGGEGPGYPRVSEGIRLWKHVPGAFLLLSDGMAHKGDRAGRFAVEMGVSKTALIAQGGALDTGDEAKLFVNIVGTGPFALVTSAWHIPRAMKLFQARGLSPVAAPCEHRTKEFPPRATCLLPSGDALLTTELAMHEYLGMVWLDLKETLTKLFRQSSDL
jgi:uncharacterized SAM-binding protein YcdF (DUF218 family)